MTYKEESFVLNNLKELKEKIRDMINKGEFTMSKELV